MIESHIEHRVVLLKSGQIALALPIYANNFAGMLDKKSVKSFGTISVGIYEHIGYVIENPEYLEIPIILNLEGYKEVVAEELGKL